MKVCFHHQPFDVDVSSGTIHALYQWFELFHAFDVTECAVINESGDVLPNIDSDMKVREYRSLSAFLSGADGRVAYVEMGGASHKEYDFSHTDWLLFGGTNGLPLFDVGIETGNVALYPREAAAIILAAL